MKQNENPEVLPGQVTVEEIRENPQANVCAKYDITRKELQEGVDQACSYFVKRMACNMQILLAIMDLLTTGDIRGANNGEAEK